MKSPIAEIESGAWKARFRLEKYDEDIAPFVGREDEFHALYEPYAVIEGEGNLLLNEGLNTLFNLLAGAGGTAFNNANARIGVGDSNAAAVATQTDLQAAVNKLYKGMNGGFPTSGSLQKITFQSSFGTTEANFSWQEWTVDNGAVALININRKVESLGTKVAGTWTLTIEITIS